MTGIIPYNSIHGPQNLIVFKYVLNIPWYRIVYQLSERTSVLLKLRLPSAERSAEKPKANYWQPLWEKCLYQFPLTVLVINFHKIQQCFSLQLQIRNETEALSIRAKHEKAATDQGSWMGHEALRGSRTGSLPAVLLLLV